MFKNAFTSLLAVLALVVSSAAGAGAPTESRELQYLSTRHVRDAVRTGEAHVVGRLPADQVMHFDILMPPGHPDELEKFLADVYNPKSPSFHHFVTPKEFTERFGPNAADWASLVRFARHSGFTLVGGSRDEMDLRLAAPVSVVEAAFHVKMHVYQHPTENRTFYSPDREPGLDLESRVWHVSGLDNFAKPQPRLHVRSAATVAQPMTTTGSCPGNSYCGSDMRTAYYGGTALTGAGQSIGLLEFYGYDSADLTTYYKNVGQTNNVPVNGISTDGTSTSCVHSAGCDDTEQTLDMTQAIGMAPGLAQLNVYVGSSDTAILSSMSVVPPHSVTGKVDAQLSCSWGWGPADPAADDPIFQKFAAQGQTFFTAAGDSAAYTASSQYVYPADDANVTVVGGTDLATSGPAGTWTGETAWSNGGGGYMAADAIALPSWQTAAVTAFNAATTGKKASTTLRNAPDVSAEANYDFYVCANQTTCTQNSYGGTSFAAPMWAGYMALVNQQSAQNGNGPIGFLNAALYAIGAAGGTSYSSAFHDVTAGSNGYAAVTGYDLATGWGSPNGTGLINALTGSSTPGFSLSANGPVAVLQGQTGSVTLTSTVTGGFNSAVALTASGQPSGVTVGFSTSSLTGAGTSTVSFQVATGTPTGSYPITLSGTGGGITKATSVTLTVTAGGFALSSVTAVSIPQFKSGFATITSTVTGGFATPVALTASGAPTGVTLAFSPATITGAGTSSMGIQVAGNTAPGVYPITITGSGGGFTRTVTVTLTVTSSSFTLSGTGSVSVPQGGTVNATVTSSVSNGFNTGVALTASGQPAGVGVTITPATLLTGSGSATVALQVGTQVAAGSYPITITGTAGPITKTMTVTLNVTVPSFTMSATAAPSIAQGASGALTVTTAAQGGFASAVTLTATGAPGTVTFSPASINTAGKSTVTFAVPTTTAPGTYPVVLTGTSGSLVQSVTANVTVTVPTLTLAAASSVSVVQGMSTTTSLKTSVGGGFSSSVALSAAGQPTGLTVSFSPATITGTGAGTSTVTFQAAASVAPGTYPVVLTGAGGSITSSTTVNVTVNAASFTLASAAPTVTITAGAGGAVGITATTTGVLSAPIALTASGGPASTGLSLTVATLNASGSTTLMLAVPAGTTPGSYPVTVTATSGSLTQTVTVNLAVVAPVPPPFALALSTTALGITHGTSTTLLVQTTSTATSGPNVALSVTGLPAGVTATVSPNVLSGSGLATITFTAAPTARVGAAPALVSVSATTSGYAQGATVAVSIN